MYISTYAKNLFAKCILLHFYMKVTFIILCSLWHQLSLMFYKKCVIFSCFPNVLQSFSIWNY